MNTLGEPLQAFVGGAYNDALTPLFLAMAPLLAGAALLVAALREKPLAETNEQSGHMGQEQPRKRGHRLSGAGA